MGKNCAHLNFVNYLALVFTQQKKLHIRHFHFIKHFISALSGSDTAEDFHVTISRELNSKIVVPTPTKANIFRPRLPNPANVISRAVVPLAPKRSLVENSQTAVVLSQNQAPDRVSRLVKSKKTKQDILECYQKDFGVDKPIFTSQVGTS